MQKHITVIHAEDQLLFREAIKTALLDYDIHVIAWASNGQILLDMLAEGQTADVILLDWEMPVLDGQKALEQIVANYPENKVIFYSSMLSETYIRNTILRMGAVAAIDKSTNIQELVATIRKAARNK